MSKKLPPKTEALLRIKPINAILKSKLIVFFLYSCLFYYAQNDISESDFTLFQSLRAVEPIFRTPFYAPPPHLFRPQRVRYTHAVTFNYLKKPVGAIFDRVSEIIRVCLGFALLNFGITLKSSLHFLNQSGV